MSDAPIEAGTTLIDISGLSLDELADLPSAALEMVLTSLFQEGAGGDSVAAFDASI
ncbi:FxSxx-COOH cyclophane-containing RiPP peptide [Acrocarpospora sp. B8E8]|uniref:FxSxx-COOH cyclophane-containing RiPP peptide n=1 Tax=Acrocarpospora sp. B8E8 TaxID=3153572 RepID=UPI00325EFC50